jgi:hypothetical protein
MLRMCLKLCRNMAYLGAKLFLIKKGTFGGWVSENILVAGRSLNYFYGALDVVLADEVIENHINGQKKRTSWLKQGGLITKGLALEVSLRVKEYMEMPGGPPNVIPSSGSHVNLVIDVVVSLKAMVARIMASYTTK